MLRHLLIAASLTGLVAVTAGGARSPQQVSVAASGGPAELAALDLDAGGFDDLAAELAIIRGVMQTRRENAAVPYLQAMLIRPAKSPELQALGRDPDRFDALAADGSSELRTQLRLRPDLDSLLRTALQCQRCDFQIDTARGAATPLPHLREAPWLAEYMLLLADLDAAKGRPWSALRRHMDIREFARDIAAGVGIVSPLSGIRIEMQQQQRLLDALPTLVGGEVSAASIERLFESQTRPAPTVRSAFAAERLFQDSLQHAIDALDRGDTALFWSRLDTLHRLRSTTNLREQLVERGVLTEAQLTDPVALAGFAARELRFYSRYVDRLLLASELPPADRAAALRTINSDLVHSEDGGALARTFAPALMGFADEIRRYERHTRAVRLLLAAAAHHESTGTLPDAADALREARPELTFIDPMNGEDLLYEAAGNTATIRWTPTRAGDDAYLTLTLPVAD
jgi:hypothetical protein